MSNESSTLFKPIVSNQPLTVLLLIENSLKIFSVWRDLREYYLNSLIDTILRVNDRALTSLAVVESSVDASGSRHPARQIPLTPSALQSVDFDFASDGRISPSRVNDCIQHLDESICSFDGSPTVHLVIVAASTPSDDCTGLTSPTSGNAPWGLLAEKLSERNIHCHLILVSGEDVSPLTMLFERTLYLQNNVEEPPPFRIDQRQYIFRLSARPLYPELGELEQNASTYAAVSCANARRNSHLDSHFDGNLPPPSSVTAFAPQNEISLVSQLKLAQGLIKKKQHSKDPQPAPFIADARVQDPTSQPYPIIPSSSPTSSSPSSISSSSSSTLASTSPPTSASTSLSSIPLTSRHRKPQSLAMAGYQNAPQETLISPTNGGRAMSLSKVDRMHRVNQASAGSSPTESVHAHMRRGSQPQIQGGGGSPGSWFTPNSHGLSQMQQGHVQRGSRVSTPDLDVAMSSPGLAAGGSSANGTLIGTSLGVGRRGATLDGTIGGVNAGAAVTSEAALPLIGMTNGTGNHDISPGSVSSYVSSDMSRPTTPGSTEDLFSYARTQGLHHQSISYQIPYQQNGVVATSQDCLWAQGPQHQQSQMQEMQLLQHQENLQQFHQSAAVPSHFYPGAYDPSSNYFPSQPTVPTQQYYLPQQNGPAHHPVNDSVYQTGMSGGPTAEQIQDMQTQQSSIPRQAMRQQQQTLRQPYNSYFHARPAVTASPPPMIVPSQSHVPLTAVNQVTAGSTSHPTMEVGVVSRSSPPRPTTTRTATGQQGQGRARASTVATSSNLKNSSSSKIAKSKRHKKSASSVSHSAFLQSTIDPHPQVSSSAAGSASGGDEIFEVPPLYAASTGVLFESMFNIKSGLLDGPAALANPEDVALVAPALGFGEGPNVLATFSSDAVEAAGGLFRSRLKERGGVVDEVTGTTLVPVPAATVGTLHGDSPSTVSSTGVGPSPMKGEMSAIQSFVDATTTTTMCRPSYPLPSANMIPSAAYPYEGQQVPYGTLNGRLNCQ